MPDCCPIDNQFELFRPVKLLLKLKIIIDFFNNYIDLIQSKQLPTALPILDLRQEIVLNVIARYIVMVANGWTPEHLRSISKKWNAFAPLLLHLKVHLNSEVPLGVRLM